MQADYLTFIATVRLSIEASHRAVMESIRDAPSDDVSDALIRALGCLSRTLDELQTAEDALSAAE